MTNQLILISPTTDIAKLKDLVARRSSLVALYLPDRFTKQHELDQVRQLVKHAGIPETHYIEINVASIVQKTWRIIKHYEQNSETALPKDTPNRKTHNQALTEHNRQRLECITNQVKQMVLEDQLRRLEATLIQY